MALLSLSVYAMLLNYRAEIIMGDDLGTPAFTITTLHVLLKTGRPQGYPQRLDCGATGQAEYLPGCWAWPWSSSAVTFLISYHNECWVFDPSWPLAYTH